MTTATLFQWVELKQDVPNSPVKAGNKGVILDHLNPTKTQPEEGYILEVFEDGETLDVVYVPISWVNPLLECWGNIENDTKQTT
ncbi:DUF4926 domain-containing protein [Cronbergia sp. UHCC 0137]|uniref:DUF4926 domain-containing protein n=1 Tax=Cronbergia sp. UHCC 0137 TaxID=3110239 RepID=UPI002B1F4DE4|nr:DUF4926 domain-containing protein [Cronbergia sp. UHCC 0137]MEA5618544.1 DUF4926 domain-containing protein [Cronbergia sp. UHCC 0137]